MSGLVLDSVRLVKGATLSGPLACGTNGATMGALSSSSISNSGTLSTGATTVSGTMSCGTNAATCGALSSSSISNSGTLSTGATTISGTLSCGTSAATCGALSSTSISNSGTLSTGATSVSGTLSCGTNSATMGAIASTGKSVMRSGAGGSPNAGVYILKLDGSTSVDAVGIEISSNYVSSTSYSGMTIRNEPTGTNQPKLIVQSQYYNAGIIANDVMSLTREGNLSTLGTISSSNIQTGTYTAAINDSSGAWTLSSSTLHYVKYPKHCEVSGAITWTAKSGTGNGGYPNLTLPYTSIGGATPVGPVGEAQISGDTVNGFDYSPGSTAAYFCKDRVQLINSTGIAASGSLYVILKYILV